VSTPTNGYGSADGRDVPVVDVDQVFPVLTTDSAVRSGTSTTTAGQDQGPLVALVLRTVLGWRPRTQDTHAFAAALRATFQLTEVEGHVQTTYVPRGVAVQADLGGVTGGQASLYERARSAMEQSAKQLDVLKPLRNDYDPEDGEAFRTLVRHGVGRLVEELGYLGGPRQAIVDSAFNVLIGAIPAGPAGLATIASYTPDTVPGQLGALRDRFGLTDANVNTVDEESLRTAFWTLVDIVLDLRRSWETQRQGLGSGAGNGFLGTDLVIINRLLAAAAEQVDEVEAVLDSALVGAAERQTITLGLGSGLTLDGLLSWARRFLTEDGPLYLRDTGRDGIRTAFAPLAQQLLETFQTSLVAPLGALEKHTSKAGELRSPGYHVEIIPASCSSPFPSGMHAARTRIAVAGLCRLLTNLFQTSASISRFPGIVLFDVELTTVRDVGRVPFFRLEVRGANLRPTYIPALLVTRKDKLQGDVQELVLPRNGSATADDDTLSGLFRLDDLVNTHDPQGTGLQSSLRGRMTTGTGTTSVLLPAQIAPIAIVDGETGQLVTAPPVLTWPDYEVLGTEPVSDRKIPDWAGVRNDSFLSGQLGIPVPTRGFDGLADDEPPARIGGFSLRTTVGEPTIVTTGATGTEFTDGAGGMTVGSEAPVGAVGSAGAAATGSPVGAVGVALADAGPSGGARTTLPIQRREAEGADTGTSYDDTAPPDEDPAEEGSPGKDSGKDSGKDTTGRATAAARKEAGRATAGAKTTASARGTGKTTAAAGKDSGKDTGKDTTAGAKDTGTDTAAAKDTKNPDGQKG